MTELDFKDQKTMTIAVIACTVIVLLVLLIDMRIAKDIVRRAVELDGKLREYDIARSGGNWRSTPVSRDYSGDRLGGNSGMETPTDPGGDPQEDPKGWDVFPVERNGTEAYGTPGIGNLAIPKEN